MFAKYFFRSTAAGPRDGKPGCVLPHSIALPPLTPRKYEGPLAITEREGSSQDLYFDFL